LDELTIAAKLPKSINHIFQESILSNSQKLLMNSQKKKKMKSAGAMSARKGEIQQALLSKMVTIGLVG
jgi:hypothetical protein